VRDSDQTNRLQVRVWEVADMVDVMLANYEHLSEETRTALLLKHVWMLQDT
jgi:predicted Mrr-cat superfamily restriction endonuclease